MTEEASINLVARWRSGDQQAAAELFRRFAERLVALARTRLSAQMSRRVDPEDVVQSAYRSFFIGTRNGRFEVQHGGDLWQLLMVITLHKLQHAVRRNLAAKRAVQQEQSLDTDDSVHGIHVSILTREPSPMEAVALADQVEQLMRGLGARDRRILELRLQGYTLEEIAADTHRSETTVGRVLDWVKQRLEEWQAEQES
jgi:RNA polymerase sigma-70 factor (ECF subfamily)